MIKKDGYVILKEKLGASMRLLCFHHAGGSALSLVPFIRNLPEDVEVCMFELPGRGMLQEEEFLNDYISGKNYFLEKVKACIDLPCIIFGHSLGGLFAYSVASSLEEDNISYLKKLVVSAARSPFTVSSHATHPKQPFVVRTFESVKNDMKRLGGIPMELIEDNELLHLAVEGTGRDFHMLDTFPATEQQKIDVPFELWLGDQDSTVDESEIALWKKLAGREFEHVIYEGGHFYINECKEPSERIKALISKECEIINGMTAIRITKRIG